MTKSKKIFLNKEYLEQLAKECYNFINNIKPTPKEKFEKLGLSIIIGGKQ